METLLLLDQAWTKAIYSLGNMSPMARTIAIAFAVYAIYVLVFLVLACIKKETNKKEWPFYVAQAFMSLALSYGTAFIFRMVLDRPRPFQAFSEIESLISTGLILPNSFPSNHATLAFALAGFCTLLSSSRALGITSLVLASMVALARVGVGVHYASDVLAGACLGVTGALVAKQLFLSKIKRKSTPLRP